MLIWNRPAVSRGNSERSLQQLTEVIAIGQTTFALYCVGKAARESITHDLNLIYCFWIMILEANGNQRSWKRLVTGESITLDVFINQGCCINSVIEMLLIWLWLWLCYSRCVDEDDGGGGEGDDSGDGNREKDIDDNVLFLLPMMITKTKMAVRILIMTVMEKLEMITRKNQSWKIS